MEDNNKYKRFKSHCLCGCEAHCNHSCQDCDDCTECECATCLAREENKGRD